jgi:hypothetical protein
MKKLTWLIALMAALALLVIGCPGGGDPDDDDGDEDKTATGVYFARDGGDNEGFTKIQDANIPLTLTEDYVRIFFDPLGEDFASLRVKFTLSVSSNISQQCAYDETGTWGNNKYLDMTDTIIYEVDPATEFTQSWGASGAKLDKETLFGICFVIDGGKDGVSITLNELTFTGASKGPTPTDSPIKVSFKTTQKNAIVKGSSFVAVSGNTITVTWNPADEDGAFRVKVDLEEGVDISSGYSKFAMDWSSGSADGGNFNITLFFSGNRVLSAYGGSGTAEFDFNDDHPDWASGWGDAAVGTITGFEIFSDDDDSFGSGTLVITKISFE